MAAGVDQAAEARPRAGRRRPRARFVRTGVDRRFAALSAVVGIASTAVFTRMLTLGRGDLLADRQLSDVFDVQARALLDGHLDVAPGALAFEGFVVDGKTYTYFGVFPSLLRMPVLVVTDRLDGRLTTLSMVLAFGVAFAASALLIARVRALVAPDRAWNSTGLVLAGLALAAVGVSSNLTFLAGGAWVYNEAALWACSGVLACFAVLAGLLLRPRLAGLAWAALWTAVAWLSRGSMGLAPTLVLAVAGVGLLSGWRPLARSSPPVVGAASRRRWGIALLAAALVPMGVFVTINLAKFDTPLTIPFGRQVNNESFPTRLDALEAYDGNLFSPSLVPATAWQTVRPDLVGPSAQWPFVDFTGRAPIEVGDPVWDTVEPSAGAVPTMPLLLALGVVGVVATIRSRGRGSMGALVALTPMAAGGAAIAAVPLTIAFIAQRYLTDAMPVIVLAAAAGIVATDHWAAARPSRPRRTFVVAAALVLLVTGTWVTLSVTWLHQRFEAPPDAAATTAALRAQDRVAERLSSPAVPVTRRDEVPRRPEPGTNLVVGDCLGLYRGEGPSWRPLEVSPARGRHRLRLRWADLQATEPAPLIVLGDDDDQLVVTVRRVDEARVALGLRRDGTDIAVGSTTFMAGREQELVINADPDQPSISVLADGTQVAFGLGAGPADGSFAVAGAGTSVPGDLAPLPATVTAVDDGTPTCDTLTDGDP